MFLNEFIITRDCKCFIVCLKLTFNNCNYVKNSMQNVKLIKCVQTYSNYQCCCFTTFQYNIQKDSNNFMDVLI